ncbi:MAG: hypothetical protein IKR11_01360 [Solobacterium sp.]|nr:hypothetical protein [Solobacterium sp.]
MKRICLLCILLLTGCSTTTENTVSSYYGRVSSCAQNKKTIEYRNENKETEITLASNSSVIILKDNHIITPEELSADDEVVITYTNEKISTISVIND